MVDTNPDLSRETKGFNKAEYKFPKEKPVEKPTAKDYKAALGLGEKFTAGEVEDAYREKEIELGQQKLHNNKLGAQRLMSDSEYQEKLSELKEARDILFKDAETPTGELVLPKELQITADVDKKDLDLTGVQREQAEKLKHEAWDKIKENPRLKSILAFCLLPDGKKQDFITERDSLTEKNVGEFLQRFPTRNNFRNESNAAIILDLIRASTPEALTNKRAEYEKAIKDFPEIMYP